VRSWDQNADNLFLRLFSYTPREGREALEDFCTEALAWCLRNSPTFRKGVFNLTYLPALRDYDFAVEIDTQHSFKVENMEESGDGKAQHASKQSLGRFDMIIRSTSYDFVVVIETKLWTTPGQEQLKLYRRDLANEPKFQCFRQRLLLSLSALAEKPTLVDAHLNWSAIQRELTKTAAAQNDAVAVSTETAFTQKACQQFAEFLKEKGIAMSIDKTNPEALASFIKCQLLREQLESVLRSVASSSSLSALRGKRPKYAYEQEAGWLCLMPRQPEVLCYVGFVFRQSDKGIQLAMHVSKECAGDRRELISQLDERLKECQVAKEDIYIAADNTSWFNFEQPVTPEYDGNGEKMREWLVQTSEAVMVLGRKNPEA
jgi:PD-(D/E)XK nuclease superfamily